MNRNKILITGIGGPAGKSAATYFTEKGFFVIGTDVREVNLKVDAFYLVPLAVEPSFSRALVNIIAKERPCLFIPTVTEELPTVSGLKKQIEQYNCALFISPPEAVEIANNKLKTALFMEKNNIPIPTTFDGSTPRGRIIKELGLPLLAKPCFGRGGRGVTLYKSAEEVCNEKRQGLIFQEFISGEEFDVNLFMDKQGKVLAAVALKKTVLKHGLVGNALEVERVLRDDVIELSKKAAKLLEMEGPLDFDIRLRKDGTPVLLEINARLGGNVLYAREVLDCLMSSLTKGG
ncbi:MAG: ATP-grasp domain-containing protein [Deltaproteobacteria bacterium]|nr:ATP-grasp domain-containing protein [Deltaproteobacteria bacterium]